MSRLPNAFSSIRNVLKPRSRVRAMVILALVFMTLIVFVGLVVDSGFVLARDAEWRNALYPPSEPDGDMDADVARVMAAQAITYHDLVLVLDRSPSMANDTSPPNNQAHLCSSTQSCLPFEDARNSAVWLVDQLNFPYDRVAVVAFSRKVLVYDPINHLFRQITNADLEVMEFFIDSKQELLGALNDNLRFSIDTCSRANNCTDNDMPGLDYTAARSTGGAIRVAAAIMAAQGRSVSATWTLLLLTNGAPNATDPIGQFTGGFCPPATWSYGTTFTVPGYGASITSTFPYAYPYCRRADVLPGVPPVGDPDLPYNQISRACFYTVTGPCKPGTTITDTTGDQYDAADYMRDQADYMASNNIMAFAIGLGSDVANCQKNQSTAWNCSVGDCSRDRSAGERLLRYVADVGSQPNTWECHSDYWTSGQTEFVNTTPDHHCGNYWYAATGSDLPSILDAIATRLNRPVAPPVANFTASPLSGTLPLTVYFTDMSTGTISSWLWQFGDEVTSTLSSPTHTYDSLGAFTVTLNVAGPGGSDLLTRTNYITVYEPVLAAFSASPLSGYRPLTVTFTNQSTGDYINSLWNFGDGMTSTLANPSHTYVVVGVYTVSLAVSGPGGSSDVTQTNCITVTEPSPVASFTASPLSGTLPLTVYFTDTSLGIITSWLWEFGDGLTGTLPSPTYTYRLTGTFDVTLMVTGPGGSDVEVKTAYIRVWDQYVVYLPIVIK